MWCSAVGSRLQDFTTGSWALFKNDGLKIVGLNVQPFDAAKHRALPLVADAQGRARGARCGAGRLEGADAWTGNAPMAGKADWLKADRP